MNLSPRGGADIVGSMVGAGGALEHMDLAGGTGTISGLGATISIWNLR